MFRLRVIRIIAAALSRNPGLIAGMLISFTLSSCADRAGDEDLLAILALAGTGEAPTVLIIGDSLTEFSSGFGLRERLAGQFQVEFRAVRNRDFAFWAGRLDEAFSASSQRPPDIVLVPLGTNDGFTSSPAQFESALVEFHTELRKRSNARVFYFQVPETIYDPLIPNIRANNARLPDFMPADNTTLIDMQSAFASAAERDLLYTIQDPIHPTERGYALFAEKMAQELRGF